MTFVYLDTETTGLNPLVHQVWEIAYAVDDQPIRSSVVPHQLSTADPDALAVNGYYERFHAGDVDPRVDFDLELRSALKGQFLVGANPAFDAAFLQQRFGCWGAAPWRYRLIDVEAMAYQALHWDAPRGLKDVADHLRSLGFNVPQPDHSAAADVATTRACHVALLDLVPVQR